MATLQEPATDVRDIPAFILAGGLGTRLRSVINDVPKPLAPIAGKPFLAYQLEYLKRQGIGTIVMLVGFKGESIEGEFGNGASLGLNIRYVYEKELLGTGGAVKNAQALISSNDFFLLNGDTFFPCDLGLLMAHHRQQRRAATIALKLLNDTSRYGRIEIDQAYRITSFVEKTGEKTEGYINAGIYALNRSSLDLIPDTVRCSLERDVFPRIAASGVAFGDPFIDIGVPEDYHRANEKLPLWIDAPKRKTLFLDRDGVVNEDKGYPHRPEDIVFIPEIFEFCRKASRAGYVIVVVTNQAGVAKGKYTLDDVERLHAWMNGQFLSREIAVTGFMACPFHEAGTVPQYTRASLFRKPEPGMILEAAERWGLDLKQSIVVGDKTSDRIRLPYLRSVILKSRYTESGYDTESLENLGATLFGV